MCGIKHKTSSSRIHRICLSHFGRSRYPRGENFEVVWGYKWTSCVWEWVEHIRSISEICHNHIQNRNYSHLSLRSRLSAAAATINFHSEFNRVSLEVYITSSQLKSYDWIMLREHLIICSTRRRSTERRRQWEIVGVKGTQRKTQRRRFTVAIWIYVKSTQERNVRRSR